MEGEIEVENVAELGRDRARYLSVSFDMLIVIVCSLTLLRLKIIDQVFLS